MSLIIDTSPISATAWFPVKAGTVNFLQNSHIYDDADILIGLINQQLGSYSASTAYVLYGCVQTNLGSTSTFTEGSVFLNGEIFHFPAITTAIANPTGGNVFLVNVALTYYSTYADPVTFTDGSIHSVHEIRQANIGTGTSGTGTISDYSSLVSFLVNSPFISTGVVFSTTGTPWTNVGAPYYNFAYKIEGNVVQLCGVVTCPTPLAGTPTILKLPASCWPTSLVSTIQNVSLSSVAVPKQVQVNLTGEITVDVGSGGVPAIVYFDGLSYRIS